MSGKRSLELFRFSDIGQSVAVVVECGDSWTVGAAEPQRYHPALLVVESDFVSGRLQLALSDGDLDDWERCLDALDAEERVEWPPGDRTPWLEVVPDDPVEMTVHDMPSTQIAVRVPIGFTDEWVEENRARLERVRKAVEL
ncbi:DUF5959 family protein [Nocardiopsis sp. FIRDI 009]|uniref:DUF5959 family protein n=1 Tax=Nocardiopsis sp. FIRDI 009 TaxID=714197 RepID=UPI000E22EB82|nr:DUF5959 family protein [Nocardiopsis sp. FIRDI 009]